MQTARERQARYRAKITPEERARRQAIDKERRWRKGTKPRSQSLMQTKPWLTHPDGPMSRPTYYRHGYHRGETDQPDETTRRRETNLMTTHNLLMSMRDSQNCLASQVLQSNHEMMDVAGAVPPPAAVQSVPPSQGCPDPASISFVVCPDAPQAPSPEDATAPALSVTGVPVSAEWGVEDWVDRWNERSAILEYDAGLSREQAEFRALDEITDALGSDRAVRDAVMSALGWSRNADYWQRFYSRKREAA